LIVALLGGTLVLYQSEALWDTTSPNAMAWNATLNATSTFGINIIPLLIIIIVGAIFMGIVSTFKGYG